MSNLTTTSKSTVNKMACPARISSNSNARNPHAFDVTPRPGGYVKVFSSALQTNNEEELPFCPPAWTHFKSQTSVSVCHSTSRDEQINRTQEGSEWDTTAMSDIQSLFNEPTERSDHMLAVAISCVMLMASKVSKIDNEYLTYAERYLRCIKDERDNHPPNVQGILNHIGYLRTKKRPTPITEKKICECSHANGSSSILKLPNSERSFKHYSTSSIRLKMSFCNKCKCAMPENTSVNKFVK